MSVDPLLKAELMRDEGFVPHVYEDGEGYMTIGYGRLVDKKRGGGITRAEAEMLLENDIERTTRALRSALPWFDDLSATHKRALLNMAFNLGVGGLLGFKKMLSALRAGFADEAAAHALDSKWARQVGLRAGRIANMLRNG